MRAGRAWQVCLSHALSEVIPTAALLGADAVPVVSPRGRGRGQGRGVVESKAPIGNASGGHVALWVPGTDALCKLHPRPPPPSASSRVSREGPAGAGLTPIPRLLPQRHPGSA